MFVRILIFWPIKHDHKAYLWTMETPCTSLLNEFERKPFNSMVSVSVNQVLCRQYGLSIEMFNWYLLRLKIFWKLNICLKYSHYIKKIRRQVTIFVRASFIHFIHTIIHLFKGYSEVVFVELWTSRYSVLIFSKNRVGRIVESVVFIQTLVLTRFLCIHPMHS